MQIANYFVLHPRGYAFDPLESDQSYAVAAFAAFRNYDGHGSTFGDS